MHFITGNKMRTIITVRKERLSRCDYSVTVVSNGKQSRKEEIKGDKGDAAASAINIAANSTSSIIVASKSVMGFVPKEFGGSL
jgi:hypothetical protein